MFSGAACARINWDTAMIVDFFVTGKRFLRLPLPGEGWDGGTHDASNVSALAPTPPSPGRGGSKATNCIVTICLARLQGKKKRWDCQRLCQSCIFWNGRLLVFKLCVSSASRTQSPQACWQCLDYSQRTKAVPRGFPAHRSAAYFAVVGLRKSQCMTQFMRACNLSEVTQIAIKNIALTTGVNDEQSRGVGGV